MSDSPDRDLEVFSEAIELPHGERAAYLARACGGDAELRQRVEALLETHDHVGDFLEQSPQKAAIDARPDGPAGEKPGDWIGRYKLLQQIGEGGCGVVFMAEQEEPIHRRVALKVVKPGMDTNSVIARFEAERQALALMDHPNIAHVHDAGATATGRPFFVMELVRGVKITDFCDQHSMTTNARLELFMQVCDAVQHAHQKGIIHRDIKPSNILVTTAPDRRALPKVIDFGIAKATTGQRLTDKTLFTAFEMLIGTPAYMSPEQATLSSVDVDTRTDIYSLGVLLYELLTGTTPFDTAALLKAGLDEVRRVISNEEPVTPSTRLSTMMGPDLSSVSQHHQAEPSELIREVRGDLDWIVMRALEKDRARRYKTANGLALDVQRFLSNETVSARPPSAIYKFQKLASRNKFLFGGSAVILLLIVVSLVLVSAALAKERHARRETGAALRRAEAENAKSREVTRFLEDMLEGVGPSVARGRDTMILKEILDNTAKRVGKELTNQPAVEADLRSLMGHVYQKIGEYSQAEKMHRGALEFSRKQFGANSSEAAASLNDLGEALSREGKLTESEEAHLEALGIRRRVFGSANAYVSDSLNNLANTYRMQHRFAEADALTREALGIRQKVFGNDSLEVADSLRNLSILLADEGKPKEAEAMTREVLAIRQQRLGRENALVASTLDDVAWAAGNNGKMDEAESLEAQSLAMKRKALGDEHPDVARSLFLLGQRLQMQRKLTDSAAILSAAYSIQCKLLGQENPDTLYTLRNLSWVLEGEGKWSEAEIGYRATLSSWRKLFGKESDQALSALEDLVRVLVAQKKFREAEQLLGEVLTPAFVRKPSSVRLLVQRTDLMGRRGRWQEAAADAALAVAYEPAEHYRYHMLAPLLAKINDRPAFEQLCRTIPAAFPDTMNPYIAERVSKDCLLLSDSGADLQWADKMADTAIARGSGDPSMPFFQTSKALSTYRQKRFRESVEWAEKALNSSAVYVQAQAHACGILAMAQWQLGEGEAARSSLVRGENLVPNMQPVGEDAEIGSGWVAWLIARVSLDEARSLIQSGKPPETSAQKP